MKMFEHSIVNVLFLIFISVTYSFLFIFTSNHMEFTGLLPKTETLRTPFWNAWSTFIEAGNMKYIGYTILVLSILILFVTLFKKPIKLKECQSDIFSKSMIGVGVLSIILIPVVIILILSDPNYTIAVLFLLATIQWCYIFFTYFMNILRD